MFRVAVAIVASVLTFGAVNGLFIAGGSFQAGLAGAVVGGLFAGVANFAHGAFLGQGIGVTTSRVLAQALAGGVNSVLQCFRQRVLTTTISTLNLGQSRPFGEI